MDLSRIFLTLKHLLYLLLAVSISACSTTNRSFERSFKQKLEHKVDKISLFNDAFTGIALYDPIEQKYLLQRDIHKAFTPASNVKIATLLNVIETMNDSMPLLKYAIKGDSLFFSGSGNPVTLNPNIGGEDQTLKWFNGHSDLIICYVPNDPQPEKYGSGWAWDDYKYYFQLENTSFPIYGNQITLKGPISHTEILPGYFQKHIDLTFGSEKTLFERDTERNNFNISTRSDSVEMVLPVHFTDSLFMDLLADTLKRELNLIQSTSNNYEWDDLKTGFEDSLLILLMHESDNFIAEQLLLMSAFVQTDSLNRKIAIKLALKRWDTFLSDEIRWVDGSGLSRYNLFTPHSLIQILFRIQELKDMEWIKSIFPQGGANGTIEDWYFPYVYAKTGTLSNNHNLSGFIETKSGRVLIFSFMHNHFFESNRKYKKEMEDLLEWIHLEY